MNKNRTRTFLKIFPQDFSTAHQRHKDQNPNFSSIWRLGARLEVQSGISLDLLDFLDAFQSLVSGRVLAVSSIFGLFIMLTKIVQDRIKKEVLKVSLSNMKDGESNIPKS